MRGEMSISSPQRPKIDGIAALEADDALAGARALQQQIVDRPWSFECRPDRFADRHQPRAGRQVQHAGPTRAS
jgi:hypothetical protein